MNNKLLITSFLSLCILMSCSRDDDVIPVVPDPDPVEEIYYIPVVIHLLHLGEAIGEGTNLSTERIERQIEILNEDFRRKEGTRGFNDHPDGGDARIEFVLAKQNPDGKPVDGIERINIQKFDIPFNPTSVAQYNYWEPSHYINIWTAPLPEELVPCIVLGQATLPRIDLPGNDQLPILGPDEAEGILINSIHFGESNINCHARFGRTLTHEMGHYLGLLHPWHKNDCEYNDYCEDTPAVDKIVSGRTAFAGCEGEPVMIGNYMNWSDDEVMNIFTNDQIARMHYVLEQHPERNSLLTSPGLKEP